MSTYAVLYNIFYDNIEWKWTNGDVTSRDNWTTTN